MCRCGGVRDHIHVADLTDSHLAIWTTFRRRTSPPRRSAGPLRCLPRSRSCPAEIDAQLATRLGEHGLPRATALDTEYLRTVTKAERRWVSAVVAGLAARLAHVEPRPARHHCGRPAHRGDATNQMINATLPVHPARSASYSPATRCRDGHASARPRRVAQNPSCVGCVDRTRFSIGLGVKCTRPSAVTTTSSPPSTPSPEKCSPSARTLAGRDHLEQPRQPSRLASTPTADASAHTRLKKIRRYKLIIVHEVDCISFDQDAANVFVHRLTLLSFGRWG
jgi:hypothetical protein